MYMFMYAVMCRWKDAARLLSLYVAISFDFHDDMLWL